ncbi:hypothetical protein V8E55_009236 [Tylopilus felleus]
MDSDTSLPFSPTTLLDPPLTYPNHLPVVYQGTYTYNGGFNPNWGAAQQQEFLYNAIQMMGGQPSTAGTTAATSGTTNNHGHQCRWFTGGVLCAQSFASFDDLMDHLSCVHDVQGSAGRRMFCQWWTNRGCCNNEYRRDAFRRHIRTHTGHSVLCTECNRPFSRKDSMRAHLRKQHGKQ